LGSKRRIAKSTPRLMGGEKELGAMAVNRGQAGGDQKCFNCGGFGHMARNCKSRRTVERNGRRIQEDKGEELKDSGG